MAFGIGTAFKKAFGYNYKIHDSRITAARQARQQSYRDAALIRQASSVMMGQIGLIERHAGMLGEQAGMIEKAGEQAAAIGRMNADNILKETGEWARRRGGEQKSQQSMNKALAAASGIRLDTGGSSDIYRDSVIREHVKEIDWGNKAGESQADIATEQGELAKQEAFASAQGVRASAHGVMAQIPAIHSNALVLQSQAGALETQGNLGLIEAQYAKEAANSAWKMQALSTAIAVGSLGVGMGWWGGAKAATGTVATTASKGFLGTGLSGVQVAAIGAGGVALAGLLAGGDAKSYSQAQINANTASLPAIGEINLPNVQAGQTLNVAALPNKTGSTGAGLAQGLRGALPSTKRQYAAQTSNREDAVFGTAAFNPLATA